MEHSLRQRSETTYPRCERKWRPRFLFPPAHHDGTAPIGNGGQLRRNGPKAQSIDIPGMQTSEDWIDESFNNFATESLSDILTDSDVTSQFSARYERLQSGAE
jgi:hypothetical protein